MVHGSLFIVHGLWLVDGESLLTINNQQSTINNQQSTINNREHPNESRNTLEGYRYKYKACLRRLKYFLQPAKAGFVCVAPGL
jgi:hypothetical protein